MNNPLLPNYRKYLFASNSILDLLWLAQRRECLIIGILLVEMYFRKWYHRLIEIIVWVISGNDNITIGYGQLQARNWNKLCSSSFFSRLTLLIKVFSIRNNYDKINDYLSAVQIDKYQIDDICRIYNGKKYRIIYLVLLKYSIEYCNEYFTSIRIKQD